MNKAAKRTTEFEPDPAEIRENAIQARVKEIVEDAGLLSTAIGDHCDNYKYQCDSKARWGIYDGLQSNLALQHLNKEAEAFQKASEALGNFYIAVARWQAEKELEEVENQHG